MKESVFVRRHIDRWKKFELFLDNPSSEQDPDRLAELFIQLTDDLSYARTYYPTGKTNSYLNGLTSRAHQAIYKRKKEDTGRFRRFWAYEIPLELYRARPYLLLSLVIFTIALLVGVVSTVNDLTFARFFLGDDYINTTLDNIAKGDPMGIYKSRSQGEMFWAITSNNILVSFLAFVYGAFFCLGTVYLLLNNGIMLGVFHTFLLQQGVFEDSLLAIYVHGTIEISSIVIAGGAGLLMGSGLLFPGTYARKDAFTDRAKRGMKIVIGLIPFFIVAGFLESFITRYTDMPLVLNLGIIVVSLALVLTYFIFWPRSVAARSGETSRFMPSIEAPMPEELAAGESLPSETTNASADSLDEGIPAAA